MQAELDAQFVKDFRKRRWMCEVKIVDRLHEAAPEETPPHPVHRGPGEEGILRAGDPLGQDLPLPDACCAVRPGTVEKHRRDEFVLTRNADSFEIIWRCPGPAFGARRLQVA